MATFDSFEIGPLAGLFPPSIPTEPQICVVVGAELGPLAGLIPNTDGTTVVVCYPQYPERTGGGSSFSPDSIAGLLLWLKADAISGLNNGDPLSTWEDSSTNGYDATQSTTSLKPTYRTNQINGEPSVRFVTDDWVGLADAASPAEKFTLFIVFRPNVLSGSDDQAIFTRARNLSSFGFYISPTNSLKLMVDSTILTSGITLSPTSTYLLTGRYDAATQDLWIDGANHAQTANTAGPITYWPSDHPAVSGFRGTGVDNSLKTLEDADVAEIILYTEALSTDDRQAVEAYLTDKYGL